MVTLTANHFDVLGYVKKSKELGVPEQIAEYQARQIEQSIDIAVNTVRAEIENKELATKPDIACLQRDLMAAELRLVKWIIGTGIAGILAIVGLIKYVH